MLLLGPRQAVVPPGQAAAHIRSYYVVTVGTFMPGDHLVRRLPCPPPALLPRPKKKKKKSIEIEGTKAGSSHRQNNDVMGRESI